MEAQTETIQEIRKENQEMKVFDLYDISCVTIKDEGLKAVINLDYHLVIKSCGRARERFGKANVNVIERLVNTISVPGHRGKKHKVMTNWATGKYNKNLKTVLEAFRIIQEQTKQNPIQVLVTAIEKGAPRDEVTMIQYGGARYPQAVDTSPLRRVSLALRNIAHGAYDKSFNKKKSLAESLAEELMAAYKNSADSFAIKEKERIEREASGAR